MSKVDDLRDAWDRAVAKDKLGDAIKALVELEKLDVEEPRWAQRLGEAYRRMGKLKEAEEAFVRATERYNEKGFLPRAIAMAKIVVAMNPKRADLLERLDPKPAAVVKPSTPMPVAKPVAPVMLSRAPDEADDEVRFVDVPGRSSIEIVLDDVSDAMMLTDADLIEEAPMSLPMAQEPSIDRLATMAAFRLFAGLSRDALLALSIAAEVVEFVPGAMVILRNEPAVALYAIVGGTARVTVRGAAEGTPEIRLGEGDVFGEACLLEEGQRQADVRAETPLMTLRIGKPALDEATARHPEIGDALFQLLARRLLTNLMHTSPLFTAFEPKVRLELAQMFEIRRAGEGMTLTERGRRSDGLYVLLAGTAMAKTDGGETRVARGTPFGHAALLGASTMAEATVTTTTDAVLLRLPAMGFASLAALYPPALAHLSETAGQPLRPSDAPQA